jgi:hypothetical protein
LVINIGSASTPFTTYLEATSKGGVKGYKKIDVVETTDPCIYTISPSRVKTIALEYVEGENISPMTIFKDETDFEF